MTRDEIKSKLLKNTKPENHQELNKSMDMLNDQVLNMCLNTLQSRQGDEKAKHLIGLQINANNTIDVLMETHTGKFYGVSIIL
jgi:restriction endonuclease